MSRRTEDIRKILEDPDVRRWHENLEQNSIATAREYLSNLHSYCESQKLTPKQLIDEFKADKKTAEDRLQDYIRELSKKISFVDGKPLKPGTLNMALCAAKSWFSHFELAVTRNIAIKDVHSTPTIENEKIPLNDELGDILNHGTPRARSIISLIAFGGIRPKAISRLTFADLPELQIKDGRVIILKEPMIIKVRRNFSKNKRPYFTFLIKEGINYLKAYLEERLSNGESLTPEKTIIAVEVATFTQGKLHQKGEEMTRKAVSSLIKRTMRASRDVSVSQERPYVLRSYYDWGLQNAKLPHIWEQFFMGHAGQIEAAYSVRKKLSDEDIEKMRLAFKNQVEPQLTTLPKSTKTDDREKMIIALMGAGKTREHAEEILQGYETRTKAEGKEVQYLQTSVMDVLPPGELIREAAKQESGPIYETTSIEAEDYHAAEKLIAQGYEYVQNIAGRIIFRRLIRR